MGGPVWTGGVTERRELRPFVEPAVAPLPAHVVLTVAGRVEVRDPTTGAVRWHRDRRSLYALAAAHGVVYLASTPSGHLRDLAIEGLREVDAQRVLNFEVGVFGRGGISTLWLEASAAGLVLSVRRDDKLEVITLEPAERPA
jgi:hypothetical protein